jgi:hypothetical protein
MSHYHTCKGKCGSRVRCDWSLTRDDTGVYCEKEIVLGPYECEDCYRERHEDEDAADEAEAGAPDAA